MILRKPYAFFIKHFRLIHIILAIFMCYSIYRTKMVLDFFNGYAETMINVAGQDLIGTLLYGIYSFIPIIIILLTIIILIVMIVKKKPAVFYMINIAIFIFAFIVIQVTRSNLLTMQQTLIDVRIVRLVRDLITVSFIVQIIAFIITAIRATGFDVKKFGFKQDLQGLEIEETDREEFEVQISVDSNKSKRQLRYILRNAKYVYLENKLLITVIGIFVIAGIAYAVTMNILTKEVVLKENDYFYGNHFTLSITDTYITTTDYKGKILDKDYAYVIVKLKVKKNTSVSSSLDIATAKLEIGNYSYVPTIENKDSFLEFGKIYQEEEIGQEYENKTLLYKIPVELKNENMTFYFIDKTNKDEDKLFKRTAISLKPEDLTKNNEQSAYQLKDTLTFENSVIAGAKLTISSFDIQKQYKLTYDFCISSTCIPSYEYVKPSVTSNYEKALLKLVGTFDKADTSINGIYDIYDLVSTFGTLHYTLNGEDKTQHVQFKEATSKVAKEKDTYYLEVLEEVMEAEKVAIELQIRNKNYRYLLK